MDNLSASQTCLLKIHVLSHTGMCVDKVTEHVLHQHQYKYRLYGESMEIRDLETRGPWAVASERSEDATGAAAANFSWGGEARQRVCEESTCNGLYLRALKDLRNVHEKSRA